MMGIPASRSGSHRAVKIRLNLRSTLLSRDRLSLKGGMFPRESLNESVEFINGPSLGYARDSQNLEMVQVIHVDGDR